MAEMSGREYTSFNMGVIGQYFGKHPWQRRATTASLAIVAGMLAAVLLYPYVHGVLLIRDLADDNPDRRAQAVIRAAAAAERDPRFYSRLEAALATDNDTQFAAIVAVLRRIGGFNVPRRDPLHIDRARALQIASTCSADDPQAAATTRGIILSQIILSGRDNRHVRNALSAAATDEHAEVRRLAALLAARLADDEKLKMLLADENTTVVSAAALSAGPARRVELVEDLLGLLERQELDVVSSAAYGLAVLDGETYSSRICQLLRKTTDPALRDRLLHVMTVLADDGARALVGELLGAALQRGEFPPAAAIVAGGKLRIDEAQRVIKAIAADATREGTELMNSQVLAAFDAAWRWPLSVQEEAVAFCRQRWGSHLPLTLIAATRAMGAAMAKTGGWPAPEMLQTLRQAAVYEVALTTQPAARPARPTVTPVPSAVAAATLWKLKDQLADWYVRSVAAYNQTLPGDYIAWHLGQTGRAEAFKLGLAMLPPPREANLPAESQPQRVYNENERGTGAMLLALSARTPEQFATAKKRIESRLSGPLGGEDNFYLRGAYQCALLILGESGFQPTVRQLLATSDFPQRRAMTALLAAGDLYALDWLLCQTRHRQKYIAFLLINKGLGEVLAACAPSLPRVDTAASEDLLHWQVRILRETYAIRRQEISLGLRR